MDWSSELEELGERQALAMQMGGPERVARQHAGGRLTVRERIDRLLDVGSFHEVGQLAGKAEYDQNGRLAKFTPANCVFGRGRIDGRPVIVAGDDFTVRGGSADASIFAKFKMAEAMALEFRLPIIRIVEGSGGGGSVKTIDTVGFSNLPGGVGVTSGMDACTENMATVPVVGLGLGSVAGLGAARLCISHYSVMVKETSAVFVAGPPVVQRLGENLDKQQLGGHQIQTKAGAVDHAVDSEEEAFAAARRFLSYLPPSVWEVPPRLEPTDDPMRADEDLLSVVPRDQRKTFKMRKVINSVVDTGSFFEMSERFGRALITGFARLDGWPVALMAGNGLHYGGVWTADTAQKLARFVDLAETFHLPVVHLVDCRGFQVGLAAESSGVIRHAVRAIAAINQTTVPWCSVIVRNNYGVGGGAHQPAGRLALRYAWPSARWGSMPLEGGVEAAYRAEIDDAADPAAKLKEIELRLDSLKSPFRTAEPFQIEEIIDPRHTRALLCEFTNLAAPLRAVGKASFTMRP